MAMPRVEIRPIVHPLLALFTRCETPSAIGPCVGAIEPRVADCHQPIDSPKPVTHRPLVIGNFNRYVGKTANCCKPGFDGFRTGNLPISRSNACKIANELFGSYLKIERRK
jgi:hypothetical protein